ncbi:hypothetical protein ACU045_02030 [Microbacterium sp. MAHUQ-60]|uniref:hypothetical protein n=1 Tax=unclassified Microbacterium TaxID=2609290 RepID=UPI0036197A64
MRPLGWVVFVIALGAIGSVVTLAIRSGTLAETWYVVPILVVPLPAFWAAFFGLMLSDSIAAALIVGLTGLVLPVADFGIAYLAAGDLDRARGYGLTTSVGLALAGIVAFVLIGKERKVQRRSTAPASA